MFIKRADNSKHSRPLVFKLIWLAAILFGAGVALYFTAWAPLIAVAFLAAVVFALAVFKNPVYGVILIVFLLPFERAGSLEIAGLTVRLSQLVAIATIIAWVIWCLARRKFSWRRNPLLIPLGLFVVANLLSLFSARNLGRSELILAVTVFVIAVSLIIPQIITTRRYLNWALLTLIVSAGLVSLFGLYQFAGDLIGLPPALTGLRKHYTDIVFGFPRVQSTTLEPLYFANYLLIPLSVMLAWFWLRIFKYHSWILVGLIMVALVAFVLTLSRGGYMGLAASLIVLAVAMPRAVFKPINIVISVALVSAVAWGAVKFVESSGFRSVDIFIEHATETRQSKDVSIKERYDTLTVAKRAFVRNPVLGIGVGGFGPYINKSAFRPPEDGWLIVNNETLELLAEVGLVGFVSFCLVILVLLWTSVAAIRKARDPFLKASLIGLTAAFVGVWVQYQTFSTLYIIHVWVLIGLIIATQNLIYQKYNTARITADVE